MSAGPRETPLAVNAGMVGFTDTIRGLVSRHGVTIFVDEANPDHPRRPVGPEASA